MLKPNNRVILISGASSGIGLAIAKLLLEEGYNLSLGVRNIEKTKNLFSKCKSQNYIIEKFEATDLKTIDSWVENTINIFGKLRLTVCSESPMPDKGWIEGDYAGLCIEHAG